MLSAKALKETVIWLLGMGLVAIVGWIDWLTLRLVFRQTTPRFIRTITLILIALGIPLGFYSAFILRYPWSDRLEVLGFPIPVMVFQLQNGQWVDFVGNPLVGLVSMFLVVSALLLLVTITYVIKWIWSKPAA